MNIHSMNTRGHTHTVQLRLPLKHWQKVVVEQVPFFPHEQHASSYVVVVY